MAASCNHALAQPCPQPARLRRTTHGIRIDHDIDAHRLVALISYLERADTGEITTSYMASAELAADMRGFDVSSIVKVEELLPDPAQAIN